MKQAGAVVPAAIPGIEAAGVRGREIVELLSAAMLSRASVHTTTPSIFIDGKHIGGSDNLAALEKRGALTRFWAFSPSRCRICATTMLYG